MIATISTTLRSWISTSFIFFGLFIVVLGGCVVKAGAWLGDRMITELPEDISDSELEQIIREANEARSKNEDKS